MILLALDTSANLCSAALFDDVRYRILALKSEDIGRGHAERLMGLLQELLDEAALSYEDINRIAVTTGPGSFTGIRVGIATARGLALGLEIPVVGVNVLEAIAFQHQRDDLAGNIPLVVAMDARRNEFFLQAFNGDKRSVPASIPADDVAAFLPEGNFRIAGSAADMIIKNTSRRDIAVCSIQPAANIDFVARLAASKPTADEKPKPLYLRPADAKPQHNFAVEHAAALGKG